MTDLFEPEMRHIYEVSEVNRYVKKILETSALATLWVKGEVSNFASPPSGHLYFTLKDAKTQISCIIYRSAAARLRFIPENGTSIILYGNLRVYERKGEYQISGISVEPLGAGALKLAFEQLKKKLEAEGLFDPAHKKPIPMVPKRVGVITSLNGAAIRDIIKVIRRRFSDISLLLYHVSVQGEGAAEEIAKAIEDMNTIDDLDVLIVGRGGGSVEDLWAFNEEIVARSIYASRIPVISAVGHQIDFTIADFVADYRAPTPSAAAEKVVAEKTELIGKLSGLQTRLFASIQNRKQLARNRWETAQHRLLSKSGQDLIHSYQQRIDEFVFRLQNVLAISLTKKRTLLTGYTEKLKRVGVQSRIHERWKDIANLQQRCTAGIQHLLDSRASRFETAVAKLNTLSPLSTLQRGYSICFQHPSGKILRSSSDVSKGDRVKVRLAKGGIICQVEDKSA